MVAARKNSPDKSPKCARSVGTGHKEVSDPTGRDSPKIQGCLLHKLMHGKDGSSVTINYYGCCINKNRKEENNESIIFLFPV
jgi:hypothetical protein